MSEKNNEYWIEWVDCTGEKHETLIYEDSAKKALGKLIEHQPTFWSTLKVYRTLYPGDFNL